MPLIEIDTYEIAMFETLISRFKAARTPPPEPAGTPPVRHGYKTIIRLLRGSTGDNGTFGLMRWPGARKAYYTCEPPKRNNLPNKSCIPTGLYPVTLHNSPRFGECLLLHEVDGRTHILAHGGNVGGDTDKGRHTHTLGCLLAGLRSGELWFNGRKQQAVIASRPAMREILAHAKAAPKPMAIEIREAYF